MSMARYFDADKHDGGFFPGVPLGDISEDDWNALPEHVRASVDASPMYRKTKPSEAKPQRAPAESKEG